MSLQSASRLPLLAPEIMLLYKAKRPEENEGTADFLNVIPRLNAERRDWLRNAPLKLHPVHPWLNHV